MKTTRETPSRAMGISGGEGRRVGRWLAVGLALGWAGAASGQTKPAKPDGPAAPPVKAARGAAGAGAEIVEQLASEDAAVRRQGADAARARVAGGRGAEARQFVRALSGGKRFDEAADLAQSLVLASPGETRAVENLLTLKVRAELAGGKPRAALADAKALFNVATMDGTADAILLLAECFVALDPNDKDVYDRFKQQQLAGAATQPAPAPTAAGAPPAVPASAPSPGAKAGGNEPNMVRAIVVDAAPYEKGIEASAGEDYASLLARGNLLLMADRVKEARAVLERMYSIAKAAELVEASEALARCIKAEDGAIGRANTWVYSIRPKRPGA